MSDHPIIKQLSDALDKLEKERSYWEKECRDQTEVCHDFAVEVARLEENENVVAAVYWQDKYEELQEDARGLAELLKQHPIGHYGDMAKWQDIEGAIDRILEATKDGKR